MNPSPDFGNSDGLNRSIRWSCFILVIAIASLVFFANLGDAQLWDRDEPRNAGCAVEMLQRGDWVVPIFNGELRFQKPVLLYWLMMAAYQIFGVNEFAARFWSAVLAVGSVALTFSIARRLFGLTVAMFGGVVLSSNIMFTVAARAATPDSTLIFFSTLAIACFVWGSSRSGEGFLSQSFRDFDLRWLLGMGISMGLAMLAKGPVGFVMPMAIIGMHLLITRRDRNARYIFLSVFNPIHFLKTTFAMRPFLLLTIALFVALPWYVWVGLKTEGDFLRIFLLRENFGRSTQVFENHNGGLWFYPVALLIGFFPWSLFWLPVAIVACRYLKNQTKQTDGVLLLLCWIGVQVGIFSIAQTKLPSYVTPCYPALSMLTAVCLVFWLQHKVTLPDSWMVAALITSFVVGLFITIGTAVATTQYLPDQFWLSMIGLVFASSSVAALCSIWNHRRYQMLLSFSVGAILFCVLLFGFGTGSLSTAQKNRKILDRIAQMPPEVTVASFECLESSWTFYSGRTIFETNSHAKPVSTKRLKFWKPTPVTTPESFAQQHKQCVFITTDDQAETLIDRLPDGFAVQETASYLFKDKQLVLIGRP